MDVAKRAAELFSEKCKEHAEFEFDEESGWVCPKCGTRGHDCTALDSIDITDLGKALECLRSLGEPSLLLMDKCNAEKFYPHMDQVIKLTASHFKTWLLYEATAEQIFEICCLAKESEK